MTRNCAEFHLIGNVARIVPLEKVTKLTVASNYRRKKGGDWVDEARFNTVNVWNSDATYVKEHVGVGDLIRAVGTVEDTGTRTRSRGRPSSRQTST